MYIRLFFFCLIISALSLGVYLLSGDQLPVIIEVFEYQLTTSLYVIISGFFLLFATFFLVIGGIHYILRLKWRFFWQHKLRKHEEGLDSLEKGFYALASNQGNLAQKHGQKAYKALKTPLSLLISAQGALLTGDASKAKHHFLQLRQSEEGKLLGIKGLVKEAIKEHNVNEAMALCLEAKEIEAKATWIYPLLIELYIKKYDFTAAYTLIKDIWAKKYVAKTAYRERAALCLLATTKTATISYFQHDIPEVKFELETLSNAYALATDHIGLNLLYSRVLMTVEKPHKAQKILQNLWQKSPHPDIFTCYNSWFIGVSLKPSKQLSLIHKLVDCNKNDYEAMLVLINAYIAHKLWGEAEHLIETCFYHKDYDERLFRYVLLLETSLEKGDKDNQIELIASTHPILLLRHKMEQKPLKKAPKWVCHSCFKSLPNWYVICPECKTFDAIFWSKEEKLPQPILMPGEKELYLT